MNVLEGDYCRECASERFLGTARYHSHGSAKAIVVLETQCRDCGNEIAYACGFDRIDHAEPL